MRLGRQRADLRQTEWVVYAKRPFAGPAQGDRAVARFRDILIHDGSSFAMKAALAHDVSGPLHDDRTGRGGDPRDLQWVRRRGVRRADRPRQGGGAPVSARIPRP